MNNKTNGYQKWIFNSEKIQMTLDRKYILENSDDYYFEMDNSKNENTHACYIPYNKPDFIEFLENGLYKFDEECTPNIIIDFTVQEHRDYKSILITKVSVLAIYSGCWYYGLEEYSNNEIPYFVPEEQDGLYELILSEDDRIWLKGLIERYM